MRWLLFLVLAMLLVGGCGEKHENGLGVVRKEKDFAPVVAQARPPGATAVEKSSSAPGEEPVAAAAGHGEAATASVVAMELEGERVYFDLDSAALDPAARASLGKVAETLRRYPDWEVLIEGNCDERGSDEYNFGLGDRRANAVKSYLVALGVDPAHLAAISYGNEKPAEPGHDEAAWAHNRRVEFRVVKRELR